MVSFVRSFLGKSARQTETSVMSSTAGSTALVPYVRPADLPAEVTEEVTAEVAAPLASRIPSSRLIPHWADAKPFPEPDLSSPLVQIWPAVSAPQRCPSAKDLAAELFAALQRQPICAGRWVLTMSVELVIYPTVCHQLGWPPRPWLGRGGVATHLIALLPRPPEHFRVEIGREVRDLQHYFIPRPDTVVELKRA
jgi:hypothetical protein